MREKSWLDSAYKKCRQNGKSSGIGVHLVAAGTRFQLTWNLSAAKIQRLEDPIPGHIWLVAKWLSAFSAGFLRLRQVEQ